MLAVGFENEGVLPCAKSGLNKYIAQLSLKSRVQVNFRLLHCQDFALRSIGHHEHRKDLRNPDANIPVTDVCPCALVNQGKLANGFRVRCLQGIKQFLASYPRSYPRPSKD